MKEFINRSYLIIILLYPTTVALSGTSLVTIALAPTIQFSPIVTSPKIFAPAPIILFLPTY